MATDATKKFVWPGASSDESEKVYREQVNPSGICVLTETDPDEELVAKASQYEPKASLDDGGPQCVDELLDDLEAVERMETTVAEAAATTDDAGNWCSAVRDVLLLRTFRAKELMGAILERPAVQRLSAVFESHELVLNGAELKRQRAAYTLAANVDLRSVGTMSVEEFAVKLDRLLEARASTSVIRAAATAAGADRRAAGAILRSIGGDPREAPDQLPMFSVKSLCNELGCEPRTLLNYARAAGIERKLRRGGCYTADERLAIARAASLTSDSKIKANAKRILEGEHR